MISFSDAREVRIRLLCSLMPVCGTYHQHLHAMLLHKTSGTTKKDNTVSKKKTRERHFVDTNLFCNGAVVQQLVGMVERNQLAVNVQ